MTNQTKPSGFRLLVLGAAKARTNDNTGGEDRELDKSPFQAP